MSSSREGNTFWPFCFLSAKIRSQGHPVGTGIMVEAALGSEDHEGGPVQRKLMMKDRWI